MNNLKLLPKAFHKASKPIFRWLGFDEITFEKIVARGDLEIIGTEYGGWVIPTGLLGNKSICYCVGCGEDISFDLGLIDKYGCNVYGFDPTPRAIAYVKSHAIKYDKYHFSDVGLWDREDVLKFYAPSNPVHVSHSALNLQETTEYFDAKVNRLSMLMQNNGHNRLDLLKIDIEGAEYKVIQSIIEDKLDIKILCVEFDECQHPLDAKYVSRIRGSMKKLIEYGYSLVNIQGSGNYTLISNN